MSNDQALKAQLGELREIVEAALETEASRWEGVSLLREAMGYALFTGGKRIRPCMTLAACAAAGGSHDDALPEAVALELIHTYSLVHDDLPAMDDDDTRRGQPTVHIKFDESTAILAGDALLTRAFEVVATERAHADRALRTSRLLARCAGAAGMVGGQVRDIQVPEPTRQALSQMHAEKTGALFVAACEMGAIAAGADEGVVSALRTYGKHVGEAFQVSDDLLDYLELGEAGGDHEEDVNLAAVLGVQEAARVVAEDTQAALAALGSLKGESVVLRMLAEWINERAQAAAGA